jgi:poly(3-hydroxybutyrate) depolymerase
MKIPYFRRAAVVLVTLGETALLQAASTIQFSANSYTVAESVGTVALSVQRTSDLNTLVSVDYATADGTATNGLKYAAVSGTLAFGAGETNRTIVVPILNDCFVGGTKDFRVGLSTPTNAVLGTRTNATVSITDNDVGVQFQFATYSVAEDAGTVLIGIVRGDDATLPVTVDLATTDVTATNGLDYAGITNTLSFAPTERLKFVRVPILNDSLKEANKTFRVTLSNPAGATLGSQKTTTVTIADNDQGFQFESATYSVAEDAGAALITVTRGDETNLTASVDYATSDLTATNGLDYTGSTNTLSFAPGEKVKLVSVPILNDGITEPTKTFRVTLSNPTGGILGPQTTTTITIQDNDPGLGFELGSHSVWEGAGAVNLVVLRGNDWSLGPITVDYATGNLTAAAGPDYQALSGTLEFQENETVKGLTIPIFRDALREGSQTFQVTLSNATGGATLGSATTTVTIQDNFFTVVPPFNSMLAIRREGGVNVLTWTGDGQLQRADRVTGPWQTLAAARSPWTVQSPVSASFYQVKGTRSVNLYIPSSYDTRTNMPLVIMLHGAFGSGAIYEGYVSIQPLAEARGFLYCYPDGTSDRFGNLYWNGTDGCCDFYNSGADDAGYLGGLIEEIDRRFAVDHKRVHLFGIWIGGYMAYRMACQSADRIAGIVALSGTTFLDPGRCQPSEPVNVLHMHATAEEEFFYLGGALSPFLPWSFPANMPPYPSAVQTVQTWAAYNGARDPVTDPAPSMDLDLKVPGLDTVVMRYTTSPPGGAVELWSIIGGSHSPTISSEFSPRVIDWLLAHPKP